MSPPQTTTLSTILSIHIDRKIFSLFPITPIGGKHFKLSEQSHSNIHSIFVSWKSLEWLASSFNSLYKDPCNHKFFRKLNDDGDTIWLEKHCNKYGYFTEITLLEQSGRRTNILIPAMEEKHGWFSFFSLVTDYPGKPSSPTIMPTKTTPQSYSAAVQSRDTHPSLPNQHVPSPTQIGSKSTTTLIHPQFDWKAMVIIQRFKI